MDLMCFMHQGTPYGHLRLKRNGRPWVPSTEQIAKMTGNLLADASQWLEELLENGVAGKTKKGVFFSKRMVRDERRRSDWRRRQNKQRSKVTTSMNKELPKRDVTQDVTPMSRRSLSLTSSLSVDQDQKQSPFVEQAPQAVVTPGLIPNVFWNTDEQEIVISEDWLRAELQEFLAVAGVVLSRGDYERIKDDLRLQLVQEPRLRAVLQKKNGEPSVPSQFKRLETLTVGRFKTAIRQKANKAHGSTKPRSKVEESLVGVSEFDQRTRASEDEP